MNVLGKIDSDTIHSDSKALTIETSGESTELLEMAAQYKCYERSCKLEAQEWGMHEIYTGQNQQRHGCRGGCTRLNASSVTIWHKNYSSYK